MTYPAIENSVEQGSPVELYTFTTGATIYHFTTGAEPVTVGGDTYTPLQIVRETVVVGKEQRTEVVQIAMPDDHPFVSGYATVVPGNRAMLILKRYHRTDVDNQLITLFQGVVRAVSFSDKGGFARVGVMPISGALTRQVPRYVYSAQCNHVLYDSWCTKLAIDFKHTGLASSVSHQFMDVAGANAHVDGWYNSGFAVFTGDYRMILKHTGNTIKLLLPFNTDPTGLNVDIYAGCDHTAGVCASAKFSNLINFGGFPNVPKKNIFNTGL